MAGSSAYHSARASYRSGLITPPAARRPTAGRTSVSACRARPTRRTDELRERIGQAIEGVPRRASSRGSAPDVLAGVLPRLYPQMLRGRLRPPGRRAARLHLHRRRRRRWPRCWPTCSASTAAIGSRSEVARRRLHRPPRRPVHLPRGQGRPRCASWRRREGIDLAASWAYSDSESDLPMLRAVGHPVAVNPDAELARVAREEGWEIMRFETLGRG